MKEDLAQLIALAAIDQEIDLLLDQRENFPSQVSGLEQKLNEVTSTLTAKKGDIHHLETEKTRIESDLSEQRDWIVKREEAVRQIKTNKEYHAALKELGQAKKTVQTLEETLLSIMTRLEEEKPGVAELESSIARETESIRAEIDSLRGRIAVLEGEIGTRTTARKEQEAMMKELLVRRYRMIKSRVAPALAKVACGTCMECNTRIPPQLYIELQKFSKIINCPRCYRILYPES